MARTTRARSGGLLKKSVSGFTQNVSVKLLMDPKFATLRPAFITVEASGLLLVEEL